MANHNNDPRLDHRDPADTRLEARPTRDVYVDRDGDGFAEDRVRTDNANTAYNDPAHHKSGTNWGKIALIAAAAILGLALLSALFTGAEEDAADLATAPVVIEDADPELAVTEEPLLDETAPLAATDEPLVEETVPLATTDEPLIDETAPLAATETPLLDETDPVATGTITEDDALLLEDDAIDAAPVTDDANIVETETTIVPLTN